MEEISVLEAIILGAVQGLTEFLPVSSSGHLQIAKELMGVELTDNIAFDVMMHLATVLSTIVVLWSAVRRVVVGFFSFRKGPDMTYALKIILSMIPVGIVGFLLKDSFNAMLASPNILLIVGAMLLLTAGLLTFAQYAKPRAKESISWGDAAIIGTAQAVATMPGLSRSGILGNKRAVVAEFSFLMVLLPIIGESFLEIIGGGMAAGGVGLWPMVAGFLSSFIVGCLACKTMIHIVNRGKLIYFAIYCTIVGLISIFSCIF